jgi:hypothetical protein
MNYRSTLLVILLFLALGLGGCATSPPIGNTSRDLAELLVFREHLLVMSAEAQDKAYQVALQELERHPNDTARLRLALVLSLPRAPWRDDAKLLSLLEDIEPDAGNGSMRRALAQLIRGIILDQQRLLREEKKRMTAELQQAVREEHQRMLGERQRLLQAEQRRADELQQKLDALLHIDRTLRRKAR